MDGAIVSYEKAIELKPNYHEVGHNRGGSLHALDRNKEAIAFYKKAVELESKL